MESCSHLQWVDSSETLGDAWYRADTFPDLTNGIEDQGLLKVLQQRFPDSSTIMFLLGGDFPQAVEVYVIYQTTA